MDREEIDAIKEEVDILYLMAKAFDVSGNFEYRDVYKRGITRRLDVLATYTALPPYCFTEKYRQLIDELN